MEGVLFPLIIAAGIIMAIRFYTRASYNSYAAKLHEVDDRFKRVMLNHPNLEAEFQKIAPIIVDISIAQRGKQSKATTRILEGLTGKQITSLKSEFSLITKRYADLYGGVESMSRSEIEENLAAINNMIDDLCAQTDRMRKGE